MLSVEASFQVFWQVCKARITHNPELLIGSFQFRDILHAIDSQHLIANG
jgi:hypothetical protein